MRIGAGDGFDELVLSLLEAVRPIAKPLTEPLPAKRQREGAPRVVPLRGADEPAFRTLWSGAAACRPLSPVHTLFAGEAGRGAGVIGREAPGPSAPLGDCGMCEFDSGGFGMAATTSATAVILRPVGAPLRGSIARRRCTRGS